MDCDVTCIAKAGTTYNMVVSDTPYLFKGGNTRTLPETVGNVLEKVRDDFGKLLFKVDYSKVNEVVNVIEDIPEPKEIGIEIIPSVTVDSSIVKNKKVKIQ